MNDLVDLLLENPAGQAEAGRENGPALPARHGFQLFAARRSEEEGVMNSS
jgi:hypothetical protein